MSHVVIRPAINWILFSKAVGHLTFLVKHISGMRFRRLPWTSDVKWTSDEKRMASTISSAFLTMPTILSMDRFTAAVDNTALSYADRPELKKAPGARILLADDLDLNRRLIADMLSYQGHEVECVGDGAAAVEAATTMVFDIVLMDMMMPVMDGLQATRLIRALSPPHGDVPIVALTANAFREDLASCIAAGMEATVTKPMSMDTLIQAIDIWRRKDAAAA